MARIKIDLHELYAKPKITQKILDDAAINVEDWIVDKVSQKMKRIEDQAFILGDGEGKPRGFLTYETGATPRFGRLQHIKTGEDGGFGEEGAAPLFAMVDSLKTEYLSQAVWIMSRSALSAIRQIKDPATGHYLWQPSLSEHGPSTLMGYPVHVTDAMPSLKKGTASASVAFGHFGEGYQIVERPDISVLRDPYSSKPFVEFVPVCPEVEIGLGIPRDTIKIIKNKNEKKLFQSTTGIDLTDKMYSFSKHFFHKQKMFDGFILKSKSPSCGIKTTKYFKEDSPDLAGFGSGLFTDYILKYFPYYPKEEDKRLNNVALREHFLTAIFTVLSIFDGNLQIGGDDFTIGAAYVPVYQTLLMTVYAAYFAGRSIEKVKQVAK